MQQLLSQLRDLYVRKIREKVNNNEITGDDLIYETDNDHYNLTHISKYSVDNLLKDGYAIHNILTTQDDIDLYQTILYDCRFRESSLEALSYPYYFLNDDDYNTLKNNLLSNPMCIHNLLQNKNLIEKLNLTDNVSTYLSIGLYSDYELESIITTWFEYFTDEQKLYIMNLARLESSFAESLIINKLLPLSYRLQILDYCYKELDLEYIFSHICSVYDELNIRLFNSLINNDIANTRLDFWCNRCSYLTIAQKNIIYNKYYNNMFLDINHWTSYFKYCCEFGKVLRKKERTVLLKKLKASSRLKYITRAKQLINFTEEELITLNTIELTHKLSRQ